LRCMLPSASPLFPPSPSASLSASPSAFPVASLLVSPPVA
jgi:hypothetical protein